MFAPYGLISSGIIGGPATGVVLNDHSALDVRQEPTNAVCDFLFLENGQLRKFTGSDGYSDIVGEWKTAGLGADYQIWFEHTGGDAPNRGDVLEDWLNMGGLRSIGMLNSDDFASSRSGTVLVKIRDVATLTELDTCTLTLTATVTDTA